MLVIFLNIPTTFRIFLFTSETYVEISDHSDHHNHFYSNSDHYSDHSKPFFFRIILCTSDNSVHFLWPFWSAWPFFQLFWSLFWTFSDHFLDNSDFFLNTRLLISFTSVNSVHFSDYSDNFDRFLIILLTSQIILIIYLHGECQWPFFWPLWQFLTTFLNIMTILIIFQIILIKKYIAI